MDAVVHDMEGGVEKCGKPAHIGMGNDEITPLISGQFIKDIHHLLVISFQPVDGFFAWKAAECLGMFVE